MSDRNVKYYRVMPLSEVRCGKFSPSIATDSCHYTYMRPDGSYIPHLTYLTRNRFLRIRLSIHHKYRTTLPHPVPATTSRMITDILSGLDQKLGPFKFRRMKKL